MTRYRDNYASLIARLQRLSVDRSIAPDARRLAIDAYQSMMVARQPRRMAMSKAGYSNLYGAAAATREQEDRAAIETDRINAMNRATDQAKQFLSAWNL